LDLKSFWSQRGEKTFVSERGLMKVGGENQREGWGKGYFGKQKNQSKKEKKCAKGTRRTVHVARLGLVGCPEAKAKGGVFGRFFFISESRESFGERSQSKLERV